MLAEGLMKNLKYLAPTDYVCFNLGNSRIKLYSDAQVNMDSW